MSQTILTQLQSWLEGMADGSIPFAVDEKWDDVYAGNVTCYLANGAVIVMFNDCDSLDYIDEVLYGGIVEPFEVVEAACMDGRWWWPKGLEAALKSAPVWERLT